VDVGKWREVGLMELVVDTRMSCCEQVCLMDGATVEDFAIFELHVCVKRTISQSNRTSKSHKSNATNIKHRRTHKK